MDVKQICEGQKRKAITSLVLRQLPSYFGIEASTQDYIDASESQVMFAVYENEAVLGFLTLQHHTASCIEVYSMGVLSENHHQGIGRSLIQTVFAYAKKHHYAYVSVKTLGPSDPDEGYRKTRAFYHAMGFLPLEESKSIWGMNCPCLFMVKHIST